jgi:sulfite exporter TauE/SafE
LQKEGRLDNALNLFMLGFAYGATVCSLTCLPYLGPYILSAGRGFGDGIRSSLLFMSGKIFCYAAAGGLSAYLGSALVSDNSIAARWIMGAAVIAFGLSIPFVGKGECCNKKQAVGKGLSLFFAGISTSLIPCPPLIAMFMLAAKSGSVFSGISYGLVYGLGLTLSPLIIACGGLSVVSKVIRTEANGFMPYMKGLSVLMIVMMGVKIII